MCCLNGLCIVDDVTYDFPFIHHIPILPPLLHPVPQCRVEDAGQGFALRGSRALRKRESCREGGGGEGGEVGEEDPKG